MIKTSNSLLCSVILLIAFLTASSANSQNLYSHSNAANSLSESNATTGWASHGSVILGTDGSILGKTGNYALTLTAGGDWSRGRYTFTTEIGEQYQISVRAKRLGSILGGFENWVGFSDFQTRIFDSTSDWVTYNFTVTANDTNAYIQVYPGGDTSGGAANWQPPNPAIVYLDDISIVKVGGSSDTTLPIITGFVSSSKTSSSIDFTWSSSDNIGIVSQVITYNNGDALNLGPNDNSALVSGLMPNTTYTFDLSVSDAAGNTQSSTISASTEIDNGINSGPNVWSEDENNSIASYDGKVQVGQATVPSDFAMSIDGKLIAEEIKVELNNGSSWPDYVFTEEYLLPTLQEIQKHIQEKGHLPNIPSAKEIEANGIELGEMNRLLLEKIEELTLYVISQKQQIESQNKRIKKLELKNDF